MFSAKGVIANRYISPNPAVMQAHAGSFVAAGSTGNQSVTGLPFQPVLIFFLYNRSFSDGTTSAAELAFGVGLSSSAQRAIRFRSEDNVSTSSNVISNQDTACIYSSGGKADFVGFISDGFTVNWTTADSGGIVSYLAFGGTAITNSALGTSTIKLTTGTQGYTGVGFQPDFLLPFAGKIQSTFPADSATTGGTIIGAASSTSARGWAAERSGNNNNPQVARHGQSSTSVLAAIGTGAIASAADLDSFNSDGFTLNYSVVSGASDKFYHLVLKGGNYKVGALNQPASTGTQTISGIGFTPKALILLSANDISSNNDATVAEGSFSIGWGTSPSARSCMWAGDKNGVSPTQADKDLDRTKIIKLFSPGSTPTLNAAADLDSFNSDEFVLNWTTVDSTARQVLYIAIG